jgi:hypothetical protein
MRKPPTIKLTDEHRSALLTRVTAWKTDRRTAKRARAGDYLLSGQQQRLF